MMHIETGDMWSALPDADLFLVTTNSTLRKSDGALVMGRGSAKEAKQRFPLLPVLAGTYIRKKGLQNDIYGLMTDIIPGNNPIGLFQVKTFYGDAARLEIVDYSTRLLSVVLDHRPYTDVHLNFPGIGNGRLNESDVASILNKYLEKHSERITIWKKECQ